MATFFSRYGKIKEETLASIGIWTICLAGYPFCMRYAFGYPFMVPLCIGLCLLIFLLFSRRQSLSIDKVILSVFFVLLCFWILQMLFRLDIAYISNIFQVFIAAVIYLTVINFIGIKHMARQYANFMVINCICGSAIAIILLFHNFPPLFQYIPHDGRWSAFYYLTFTNVVYDLGNISIIRYSGLFDEPGTVALFSMYALLMNRIILKNKKIELLLIILPILTFSLAHIITVIIYIILFHLKRARTIVVFILLIGISYSALEYSKDTDYYRLYDMTIGRMQKDDDGRYVGDNRSNINENAKIYFKESPIFGKGKSFFENNEENIGGISFYGALYGIVGYIFIYIILIYMIYICVFKGGIFSIWLDGVKCCLIIIVNLFQRPDVTNVFQLFSIVLCMLCIYDVINRHEESKRIIFRRREKRITTVI